MARDKLYDVYLVQYNKLAKKADRRMRELERFSRDPRLKNILNYAYRSAGRDIIQWTPPQERTQLYEVNKDFPEYGPKKLRWQRNTPMDTNTLKAKIKDIEKFLSKPTSTMTGTIKIYKKRAETINKKYGTNFTWETLATYFESGLPDKMGDKYGSKTTLLAIGKIQQNKKAVLDQIENKTADHVQVSNVAVQHAIDGMLAEHGLDLKALLNN